MFSFIQFNSNHVYNTRRTRACIFRPGDHANKGGIMSNNTRREHLKMLLGMAALGGAPVAALGAPPAKPSEPVPPQGIGYRIEHISYSDQGGRPDGVQVMVNRKHVYLGHMSSDGVTILDA